MYWLVKNSDGKIFYKSIDYTSAYCFLLDIPEEQRKTMGIYLDFEVEDWS